MRMLEKLLVPLDFEPGNDELLRHASLVARKFGSQVILVHAFPDLRLLPEEPGTLVDMARANARSRLEQAARRLLEEGVPEVQCRLLEGEPFERIVTVADEQEANVVMLAARPAGSCDARLGTTAERVCRKGHKPVWVVHPAHAALPRSLLCPVDFSEASHRALGNAIHLARQFDAELTVLTVAPPIWTYFRFFGGDDQPPPPEQGARLEAKLAEFVRQFDLHGVRQQTLVRRGEPHREILTAVQETDADLVVMGTVGRTGVARILMGSVTAKILRALPCSVITVKAANAIRLNMESQLADLETHFQQGKSLLELGFPDEARRHFQHCVATNALYAPAWVALGEALHRLGDAPQAAECRNRARQITESLSWQQVEDDIRRRQEQQAGQGL